MQAPLQTIDVRLPQRDAEFETVLFALLANVCVNDGSSAIFASSNDTYLPRVSLSFHGNNVAKVVFTWSGDELRIPLVAEAGGEITTPPSYRAISISDASARLAETPIVGIDHVGFDLPYFDGEHPMIGAARAKLWDKSAYHRFPSGELWDFILPCTAYEATSRGRLEPVETRRPKFELVTIDTTMVPIVQIDVMVEASYPELASTFPEAIHSPALGNVWVYLKNDYEIDVCLVIGGVAERDWSDFFNGHRFASGSHS